MGLRRSGLRGISRRGVILLAVALGLAVAAYAAWRSVKNASTLLAELIAESKLPVLEASEVDRLELDGTQPEAAMQSLTIPATAQAVRTGFRQACRRAGLGAPNRSTLGSEPDALCEGTWRDMDVTVTVQLNCAQSCQAHVAVYRY